MIKTAFVSEKSETTIVEGAAWEPKVKDEFEVIEKTLPVITIPFAINVYSRLVKTVGKAGKMMCELEGLGCKVRSNLRDCTAVRSELTLELSRFISKAKTDLPSTTLDLFRGQVKKFENEVSEMGKKVYCWNNECCKSGQDATESNNEETSKIKARTKTKLVDSVDSNYEQIYLWEDRMIEMTEQLRHGGEMVYQMGSLLDDMTRLKASMASYNPLPTPVEESLLLKEWRQKNSLKIYSCVIEEMFEHQKKVKDDYLKSTIVRDDKKFICNDMLIEFGSEPVKQFLLFLTLTFAFYFLLA